MSSLSGKSVLVTGADGFIGSHLVERLVRDGAAVRALCLYNSTGSAGWLEHSDVRRDVDVQLADIRDSEQVRRLVVGADVVLHLAALIAIPYSYAAPRSYVETNIVGTLNVLEAVRSARTPRLVHTSTSEVYGTPETTPITVNHPLRGQSPYSASKIAADKLCESYAYAYEIPVTVLRPFNTYGPRQSMRAVIPTILAQLLSGMTTVHLGSLMPRRDFTFVDDTVDGFVRAAVADLAPGAVVQLGTGRDVSIRELFDMCVNVTGQPAVAVSEETRVRPKGSEVEVLQSDPTQARDLLEWEPHIELEDGLARTAEWIYGRVERAQAEEYMR